MRALFSQPISLLFLALACAPIANRHPSKTVFLSSSARTYADVILEDHPMAYFRLTENGGGTAYDYSGNSFHLNFIGGFIYSRTGALSREPTNTAIGFDGLTSIAYRASSTNFAFPNTTFTVEAWIKPTATNNVVISNGGSSGLGGWAVLVNAGGGVSVILKNAINALISRASVGAVNDGNWHHIAIVITTDTIVEINSTIRIYIDGSLNQNAMNYPGTGPYMDPAANYSIALGARGVPLGSINLFTGDIDEVAVYSTGLSTAQIANHYASRLLPE